jgi:FtsZ-binding cell division protein ZapB
MEKLEAKLKSLTENYDSLQRELNEVKSTASHLSYKSEAIQFEISLIHDEMRRLSGEIDEDIKICLFEDLDRIDKLHSIYKYRAGEIFTLTLNYDESIKRPYDFKINTPSLYQCNIEITTRSKMICDVIRKSFNNEGGSCCSTQKSEVYKMNETMWVTDGDRCCTSFVYDAQIAKSLLCPEFDEKRSSDNDRTQRRYLLDPRHV